jgi:signal transduction histidine kinase
MASTSQPEQPVPAPTVANEKSLARREETDDSLRAERHTADDRALVDAVQHDADRVVELARLRADAIVTEARDKADEDRPEPEAPSDVVQERADADDVLTDERALADEILRRERQDSARVLSALLPLERKSTDWKLLTERASSDAALGQRDDFLGIVSHDLNNLLAGICMSADILARPASETPEGKRIAKGTTRIQLYAARMKRLIGDLTDVTSLSAGKLAIVTAPNDGRALAAEAVETFRMLAGEKHIQLTADLVVAPLPVQCDRGRILQVLANLLGNAVKFTADGGSISARAESVEGHVLFSVTDTGPGIAEDLLEAVFERFWQARSDRRGLGLGLYIAKSIVEAHCGRIWVESRLGHGSAFHFTLPCDAGSSLPAASPAI